jgi:enoyl-CoA hydratase/carnithine racemase
VRSRLDNGVLEIVLERPDVLNAMDPTMRGALTEELDAADVDERVCAIVITGAGRGFCAGADLRRGTGAFTQAVDGPYRDGGGTLVRRMLRMSVPLIAAVNGPAAGIGAAMTLGMDIRLAAESARFVFPYTRLGIPPEGLSSLLLRETVGLPRALQWMLTGASVSAADALAAGLVAEVVPDGTVLARAREMALGIAASTSAIAVAVTRRLIWGQLEERAVERAHVLESRTVPRLAAGADAAEALTARREGREPRFRAPRRDAGEYPWGGPDPEVCT